jgi:hypothetical protein
MSLQLNLLRYAARAALAESEATTPQAVSWIEPMVKRRPFVNQKTRR